MNATQAELTQLVGRSGTIEPYPGLIVAVRTGDVKRVFGRVVVLIRPDSGTGECWVNLETVTLD